MKKEQKTYDITYDNKEKIKRLNADYFSYFQDIEKSLTKRLYPNSLGNSSVSHILRGSK